MKVIAIAAVGKNGVIGNAGKLPWDIPEDMRFFRDSTRGQIVVMGRKTYDSLGKALPKRENAVITRDPKWTAKDASVFHDFNSAIRHFLSDPKFSDRDVFVIGGAEIYSLSIPFLDEIWLTEIDAPFEGDVFFPSFRAGMLEIPGFGLTSSRPQSEDPLQGVRYRFQVYSRLNS